jgi:hypothetical protein
MLPGDIICGNIMFVGDWVKTLLSFIWGYAINEVSLAHSTECNASYNLL